MFYMFNQSAISKSKRKLIELFDNLDKEDFKFINGTQTININPNEIIFKKCRKSDGTKFYETEITNISKPACTLNNPKILFETSVDNFEAFQSEFCDCEKAEIECFFIAALLTDQNKIKFIKNELKKILTYRHISVSDILLNRFLINDFIFDLETGLRFIEYNIPYITDTKEFPKDYESILFGEIKAYLKMKLYEIGGD